MLINNDRLTLLSTVEDIWDSFMDMDAGILIIILFVVVGVLIPIFRVFNAKVFIDSDKNGVLTTVECTILEKHLDQADAGLGVKVPVEYISIETNNGERRHIRNVNLKAFGILPGDHARITLRNNTVYGYTRIHTGGH